MMKLSLSCFKCGSTDFKLTEQPCTDIENSSYLLHDNLTNAKVICDKCGLEDFVENLVIKLS